MRSDKGTREDARRAAGARARTRDALLDAMGRLLETKGLEFSLPALAAESGVATATVYRHFDNHVELRAEFYNRIFDQKIAEIAAIDPGLEPIDHLWQLCRAWVELDDNSARAAAYTRSAEGYLERLSRGEPLSVALYETLAPVFQRMVESGVLPTVDLKFATFVWVAIFDERNLVDLRLGLGLSNDEVTDRLCTTLLRSLSATTDRPLAVGETLRGTGQQTRRTIR